jgi:hypothetical protein
MALQVNITNITQATYPVDVYVCSGCPDNNCTLVDTINSVPSIITIPGPYSGYSSFGVKIIDSKNCEYCQTFQSGTTTTTSSTSTTTINPLCFSCDVGFDFYDTNPISEISVGLVTASCDPSVTDYVIEWYGPGIGSTTVALTSGYGTDYTGDYSYTHPLTGSSAVPVVAGIYTPIIQKIKLNGVEYTDLNCFNSTTVDVDALTCDNGPGSTNPDYSHSISFTANTNVTPQPLTTTFVLDPTKPYFAFRFETELIYDTLKVTFYGTSYSDPIVIEYITVGDDAPPTNLNLSLTPKTAKTIFYNPFNNSNFAKVLNLSNFTINSGDYLELEIIPNPINNNTNWKLYCECLETFNCDICYDTNITQPVKIIESSINVTLDSCNRADISIDLSACTNSDIYKYLMQGGAWNNLAWNGDYWEKFSELANNLSASFYNNCSSSGPAFGLQCNPPSTSTITYDKIISGGQGLITMTFTNYNDMSDLYNDWQLKYISYSGNPTDCNDPDYYRFFKIKIPLAVGTQNCGDLTGYQDYYIHPSALVTSGGTGPWTISITMPTITDCITYNICDFNCQDSKQSIIDYINESSTGITNNISITNNVGSRLDGLVESTGIFKINSTIFSAATLFSGAFLPKYTNQTIPYSGSPLTIIPSLSAETCSLSDWKLVPGNPLLNNDYYIYMAYQYKIIMVNPLDNEDFEIWAPTFINGAWVGYPSPPIYNKIYDYIGGVATIYDSNYFI